MGSFDSGKLEFILITEQQKNTAFFIVLPLLIVLLLAWNIYIYCNYPYYFIWDMDYVTSLDLVLIQSGLLPDHINHTCFGMYLFLFFSQKITHFLDIVSVLNLEDVAGSLNPIAAMAELTDFIRLHSPFLAIGVAVLLCMALQRVFAMSRWYVLVFLAVLGTQESFTYNSSMIRTELYSVFYFSGAVLTVALAAKSSSSLRRWLLLLLTGLLSGLSFLTKIQSLFYIASLPFLLGFIFSFFREEKGQVHRDLTKNGAYRILVLSLINVVTFLYLFICSYLTTIPPGTRTWAASWGVTPLSFFFFFALLSLFLIELFFYLKGKTSSEIFRYSAIFSVLAAGFLLSFALHFLLFSNAALSLRYLLYDFKAIFLRRSASQYLQYKGFFSYFSNLLSYISYNPVLFVTNIVLTGLVVFGYLYDFVRITKRQLLLCLIVSVFAYVNIAVGVRFMLRDILWAESLINFLSLLYFAILVSRAGRYRLALGRVGGSLLIIVVFVNCIHSGRMPKRMDANYNHYGWWEDRWFSAVFRGNQLKYQNIIRKRYGNANVWVAKDKAADHRRIRRTVDYVFKNQNITHRNIGIVFEGLNIWSADTSYRISRIPSALRGAILVDNASVELERGAFFEEEYISEHSEFLDKFKKDPPNRRISVLNRRDLSVFLFVTDEDVARLLSNIIVRTPYVIAVQSKERTLELRGLEIENYCEIPLDKITRKFFFVILRI